MVKKGIGALVGGIVRLVLPVVILGLGGFAYHVLSQDSGEEKRPEARERKI